MREPSKIVELRSLLKKKFPQAHAELASVPVEMPSSLRAEKNEMPRCIADLLEERGTVVEVVGPRWSGGSGLLLVGALEEVLKEGYVALIDGKDGFEPWHLSANLLPRLLWVRCREVAEVLKAADRLLRDGNLLTVVADLVLLSEKDLRRVPDSSWHRLRSLVERGRSRFWVFTPSPLVAGVRQRFLIDHRFTLDDLEVPRVELLHRLKLQVLLDRRHLTQVPQFDHPIDLPA